MASPKETYDQRLARFVALTKAADPVLIPAIQDGVEEAPHLIAFGKQCRELAEQAEGPMRRVASLKQLESDYLVYWNEASGKHIDHFWKAVEALDIGFERRDHLAEILAKGRILNRQEYEIATDSLVGAEQEGRITAAQSSFIARLIGEYETRKANKKS